MLKDEGKVLIINHCFESLSKKIRSITADDLAQNISLTYQNNLDKDIEQCYLAMAESFISILQQEIKKIKVNNMSKEKIEQLRATVKDAMDQINKIWRLNQ